MMERLALEQFKAWKDKEKGRRKPLLVTGVRQCGKTYLIRHFGETEFEEMAYFKYLSKQNLRIIPRRKAFISFAAGTVQSWR